MENTKILEMLEKGEIENLKILLRDEIFVHSINKKSGTKERYAAMKKYFSYVKNEDQALQMPCLINFKEEKYTSFVNGYSLVLTKEDTGEIMLFENPDKYLKVEKMITFDGEEKEIDINKILAEAKSKGYKLKKSEVENGDNFKFLLYYDMAYYKIGLLDASYSIINDGNKAIVYHRKSERLAPIIIKNNIGICIILPINYNGDNEQNIKINNIVVEVE